ncbi:MAG: hypothetical protein H6883_08185 [Rhodobiaceae bacterium]|nr:hypothetical protein [Rhodobiaceae bacterium]MCC0056101.1 hypothetical protein [Rhodobiaceae bacterium]
MMTASSYLPQIRRVLAGFLIRYKAYREPISVVAALRYVRVNYPECDLADIELSRIIAQETLRTGFILQFDSAGE